MGQYWLVVCPSKSEYTTKLFGRKLSVSLFSSWATMLSQLIEDEWAGMPLICIGDCLSPDDLPVTIRQDNLQLISNESNTTSKPLRYDFVEENFEIWSYTEDIEEATTPSTMEASVKPKSRALRNVNMSWRTSCHLESLLTYSPDANLLVD